MPSLMQLSHVNSWTTTTPEISNTNMWIPTEEASGHLHQSMKSRAEKEKYPVAGIDHERLLRDGPEFDGLVQNDRDQRDLVASTVNSPKYYFVSKYVSRRGKNSGSYYLQIEDKNVTSTHMYHPPLGIILMTLACSIHAFAKEVICQDHKMDLGADSNASAPPSFFVYILTGESSGKSLCMNDRGKLYTRPYDTDDLGMLECAFHVIETGSGEDSVIYSYKYPKDSRRCQSQRKRSHIRKKNSKRKHCKRKWYVSIKNGEVEATRTSKTFNKLHPSAKFARKPMERLETNVWPSPPTIPSTPLHTLGPSGSSIFHIGKTNRKDKSKKKEKGSRKDNHGFNLLRGPQRGKQKSRKKKTYKGTPFFLGDESD